MDNSHMHILLTTVKNDPYLLWGGRALAKLSNALKIHMPLKSKIPLL